MICAGRTTKPCETVISRTPEAIRALVGEDASWRGGPSLSQPVRSSRLSGWNWRAPAPVAARTAAAAKVGLNELERLRRAEEIGRSLGRAARSRLPDAANAVLRASIVTARDLAATLSVSPQAALGLLRQLTEAGLVREATNQKS